MEPSENSSTKKRYVSRGLELYLRLARPTLDWIGALGVLFAVVIGPLNGIILPEGFLAAELAFVAALYGIRTYEKKGAPNNAD